MALVSAPAAHADQPMDGCRIVSVSLGRCLVEALDPARGDQSARPAPARKKASARVPRAKQSSELEQARRAAAGAAEAVRCGIAPSAPGCAPTPGAQVAPGAPQRQTPQAPSVAQAAQMAVKELPLTAPSVHLSVGDQAFVGVPVWLWIDQGTGAAGPAVGHGQRRCCSGDGDGPAGGGGVVVGASGCAGGVPGGGDAVARSGGGVTGLRLHLSTAVVARADGRLGTLAGDRNRRVAGRLDRVLRWGAGRGSADGAAEHADLAAGR